MFDLQREFSKIKISDIDCLKEASEQSSSSNFKTIVKLASEIKAEKVKEQKAYIAERFLNRMRY